MPEQTSGWYADPTRRHTYRFWDGATWSNQVSDGGAAGVDPVDVDEAVAAIPPAPGTQAPGMQATTNAERPPAPKVEVTQRSGGSGVSGIVGVLVGAIIVIVILVVLFNNLGDDSSATTDAPDPTATTEVAPTTEVVPTSAP
jgi:hypothetical protein